MTSDAASIISRLRSRRAAVYASGKIVGVDGREFEIWPSGLTEAAGLFLLDLVLSSKPSRTIETGLAFGLSASFILEGLLTVHASRGAGAASPQHTAIDPYQSRDWGSSGVRLIEESGATPHFRFLESDSTLALPSLVEQSARFDFAFIDGGRNFEFAFADIFYIQRMMIPGGTIVVDDVWMTSVRAAVNYFVANLGFTCDIPESTAPGKRFAILRTPEKPAERKWDHFVPFDHLPVRQEQPV